MNLRVIAVLLPVILISVMGCDKKADEKSGGLVKAGPGLHTDGNCSNSTPPDLTIGSKFASNFFYDERKKNFFDSYYHGEVLQICGSWVKTKRINIDKAYDIRWYNFDSLTWYKILDK